LLYVAYHELETPPSNYRSQSAQEQQIYFYLTAFGVFRWPPWKELSCKLQTALAQAQQEHGSCVKHGVRVKHGFRVKQRFV
jgi:hypothetical protein